MIKNVYIYLVLFATLMMTIGGSVAGFMALADIIAPQPYYQTFEDYSNINKDRYNENFNNTSEEELRKRYDRASESHYRNQINRAKNSLIKSLGWILIPFPIFIYYQRKLVTK